MHKVTFFPIGNADCCLVELDGGHKLLFDFADCRDPNDPADKRIDLATALRGELESAGQDFFDVVAFTHVDDDHVHGAGSFFYLLHAKEYQAEDRIKINEMWVPAAVIVENGLEGDARILQAEARFRLRTGDGIRVFSRPERLKEWLEKEGLTLESRAHLITDAGQTIPGFTKLTQGVEFFVHSPFAARLDGELVDRNDCSLVLQATFSVSGRETRLILSADTTHDVLTQMIEVTKYHNNEDRLEWDVFKLPHHCSYLSLSSEKGTEITEPVPEVKWLFETQGAAGGIIVSTSWPIPTSGDDAQPPHRQAANYYKQCVKQLGGEFKVIMEHPTQSQPEPLVITVDGFGATIKKRVTSGGGIVTARPAPRAG
jgi:hypothetical protein